MEVDVPCQSVDSLYEHALLELLSLGSLESPHDLRLVHDRTVLEHFLDRGSFISIGVILIAPELFVAGRPCHDFFGSQPQCRNALLQSGVVSLRLDVIEGSVDTRDLATNDRDGFHHVIFQDSRTIVIKRGLCAKAFAVPLYHDAMPLSFRECKQRFLRRYASVDPESNVGGCLINESGMKQFDSPVVAHHLA